MTWRAIPLVARRRDRVRLAGIAAAQRQRTADHRFKHYDNPYSVADLPATEMEIRFQDTAMRLKFGMVERHKSQVYGEDADLGF